MDKDIKTQILETIKLKSETKQRVYDHSLEVFNMLKEELQSIVQEFNKDLKGTDERILLQYKDRGVFEAEIKVAGDLIIFNLHSNIFEFESSHNIWKTSYIKEDRMNSFCGMISVYNFLADSFKYNRMDDLGYLISRLFINKDLFFFVEGKHQMGFYHNDLGTLKIDREKIREIILNCIQYSLELDLLVPPYRNVLEVSVSEVKERINKSKTRTGKRLGFHFYSEDEKVV